MLFMSQFLSWKLAIGSNEEKFKRVKISLYNRYNELKLAWIEQKNGSSFSAAWML